MKEFYLVDFFESPIKVDEDIFYNHITLLLKLNYPLQIEKHFFDTLNGEFTCFFYEVPDGMGKIFVAFKSV